MKRFFTSVKPFLLHIRNLLIPPGTRREGWYYIFRYIIQQRRFGFINFLRKIWIITQIKTVQVLSRQKITPEEIRYQIWIKEHEPSKKQLILQKKEVKKLVDLPRFAFFVSLRLLDTNSWRSTLESIFAQTYHHWSIYLFISSKDLLPPLLIRTLENDLRLHLIEQTADNQAPFRLNRIAEDFVMFIREGDILSPQLLYVVTEHLRNHHEIDILYFDEDRYDLKTRLRTSPWFKPDNWSPDLMLSTNILRHAVIRKALLMEENVDISPLGEFEEWDLMLRITERTTRIFHIAQVLYHDSQWEKSEINSFVNYSKDSQWMASSLEGHLERRGNSGAKVCFLPNRAVRVKFTTSNRLVSIIIPNKNSLHFIQPCITSILKRSTYSNYEILLVDNQSDQEDVYTYYRTLASESRIRLLSYPHPFNFHKLNNWAVSQAHGEVLIFLNNDTEVLAEDWLEEIVGCVLRHEVGVVGAKLLRPNGKIQHAGMIIGLMGHAGDIFEDCEDHVQTIFGSTDWYRNYQAVTGACLAIRKEVFEQLGGFDEKYIVGYGDIDLCLRAKRLGYQVLYTPFAVLKHHEGGTRKLWLPRSDVLRATLKMWSTVEQGDVYFNPNLSYHSRVPVYACPNEESRPARLLRILQEYALVERGASINIPEILTLYDK